MSRSNVHLIDLPDEILLMILKKLSNIDVLHSLSNVDNGRLDSLAQAKTFTSVLNFVSIDNLSLIDRFCIDISPRIHHHVKYIILKPVLMECILAAANYPNLTELKLFHFRKEIACSYFINESSIRSILQEQITTLILVNDDTDEGIGSLKNYTRNVYAHILNFCKNLIQLSILESSVIMPYPGLRLSDLPSTTFSSSILTHLCINIEAFDDCLYLLDGRLKKLTTLAVTVYSMDKFSSVVHNMDILSHLKCFSLKCFYRFQRYDKILSLLRRMSYLAKLTLYLRIKGRSKVIDGISVQSDILAYIPQLHSFTFYICTYVDTTDFTHHLSSENIQQTSTNIAQENVSSIVTYICPEKAACSIFSLPFAFDYLESVGNRFPQIVFRYVTYLLIDDVDAFRHEFFIRVARSFPLLTYLRIINVESQLSYDLTTCVVDINPSYSVIEYLHLISLDVQYAHKDYLDQFLNETKAYVPCLTELAMIDRHLNIVTNNFTREETRRNCSKVKRLLALESSPNSKDFCHYFPSL